MDKRTNPDSNLEKEVKFPFKEILGGSAMIGAVGTGIYSIFGMPFTIAKQYFVGNLFEGKDYVAAFALPALVAWRGLALGERIKGPDFLIPKNI